MLLHALPEAEPQVEAPESVISIEQYVKTYFEKAPILVEVARCESRYRQFINGTNVLRGRMVSDDIGIMQINETFHKAAAEKLGYDIYTLDGNLAYAEYLYSKEGTRPWSASERCWNKAK